MDWNEIGRKIKTAREKKKLTQMQLAEKVGVTNVFISQIESGQKKASADNLAKISKALNIKFF
ncbi:MAG: helix-turn-helix transcriptional regulator [Eubacteriales bacterium]|nr:helix-turn-helix transcriptional regulator [Eubacteriales bacterium]